MVPYACNPRLWRWRQEDYQFKAREPGLHAKTIAPIPPQKRFKQKQNLFL
jgi:hypothetical protein